MMNLEGLILSGSMPPVGNKWAQDASHAIQEPNAGASLRRFGDEFDNEVHRSCFEVPGDLRTRNPLLRVLRRPPNSARWLRKPRFTEDQPFVSVDLYELHLARFSSLSCVRAICPHTRLEKLALRNLKGSI